MVLGIKMSTFRGSHSLFFLPHCLSEIKISLYPVFLFVKSASSPTQPMVSILLWGKDCSPALACRAPMMWTPHSLLCSHTAFFLFLKPFQMGSFSELFLGILSPHLCLSHCLTGVRSWKTSHFPWSFPEYSLSTKHQCSLLSLLYFSSKH